MSRRGRAATLVAVCAARSGGWYQIRWSQLADPTSFSVGDVSVAASGCDDPDCLWCHMEDSRARWRAGASSPTPHDTLVESAVELLDPDVAPELAEPPRKQSYEEWHADCVALLAEQEARHG